MFKKNIFCLLLAAFSANLFAFNISVKSLRTTLSKPDTSNTLIYQPSNNPTQKTAFLLTPQNNERLGFFLDVNDIEIGYAVDVFKNDIETKTQDLLFSYRKLNNSKITFNYQTLEGLNTDVENLSGAGFDNQFINKTKSTKLELFGLHNLYTFNKKEALFNHFFLNKPKLSNNFGWSLGIIGGWSLKHVSLTNSASILFTPNFLANETLPNIEKLNSSSFNASIGPLLSIYLPNNFHAFAEYKIGKGHIKNSNGTTGLKESGDEENKAIGAGISWTSSNKKWLVLLRGWNQKGRHIETSFGDLSVVYFFKNK